MKRPALLGGLFIGLLSSLPIVSAGNFCCCLWVVTGGALTAYLLQQSKPEPIETADAVVNGLLAGILGAVMASVVSVVIFSVGGQAMQDQIRSAIESNPQVPSEMRDQMLNLMTGRNLVFLIAFMNLVIYPIFSMLGALLGVAMFRKKTPPVVQG
jgi:hypothetical protein